MKSKWLPPGIVAMVLLLSHGAAYSAVEWEVTREMKLEGSPVDMVLSEDGKRTFVLVKGGEVHVYGPGGAREEIITLGFEADSISLSPRGDRLYLGSGSEKVVRVVDLRFVQEIPVEGSPYKGPASARVVIAVFSDFQ